ncbi:MAG: D-amino acid dehydrogenase [Gammaproteobacteria bacterium]|jgi:D-amino-acid dehydrogenase|nr:MAG: D-amino acid dehydrogenase [Gammaproteobacteria bacterium]
MRIAVLGAGISGVTSAWYLARDGHDVTVIDRQPGPGLETSFANGAQISVSHPEPWANPWAPRLILRWLGREDAPLLFRPRADPEQWRWALGFLRECLPARTRRNTDAIANLAIYSLTSLHMLREESGIEYTRSSSGILQTFFTRSDWQRADHNARLLRSYGIEAQACSASRCTEIEPALANCSDSLHGGIHAPQDETGDAHEFVAQLAQRCRSAGVHFCFDHAVEGIEVEKGTVSRVRLRTGNERRGELTADAYVIALGSYSALFADAIGERLPIYPVKGYSVTLDLADNAIAPTVSITDESRRIVCSRLGNRLRIAGTAELNGFDTEVNRVRCEAILARARQLFPDLGDTANPIFWAGLRPATPSNVPIIGRARLRNLWFNTGHGTLGWTLGCGSARALATLIAGRTPDVAFPFRQA